MKISVIIPTINRKSLDFAVASVATQMISGDKIIIVGDGVDPQCSVHYNGIQRLRSGEFQARDSGDTPRNFGISKACGDLIAFLDDDDSFLRTALSDIRKFFSGNWSIFRTIHEDYYQWRVPEITSHEICSSCIVTRNIPNLPKWSPHPKLLEKNIPFGGDLHFAEQLNRNFGQPHWVEAPICLTKGRHYGA